MITHQKEIKPVMATPNVTISAERIMVFFSLAKIIEKLLLYNGTDVNNEMMIRNCLTNSDLGNNIIKLFDRLSAAGAFFIYRIKIIILPVWGNA